MADVTLQELQKAYGATRVVRGVSLEVRSGEFFSLLGPSGCGKTTTLRMIAGLEFPDAGTIRIGDELVDGPGVRLAPERRRLGMVFQSYAVWPHRSVFKNVAYPLTLQGVRGAELERRTLEALRWVRLEALAQRMPSALSGGQLQRVALARALVSNPRVLLLDEPLSNLDAALREELRAEIALLRARLGTTMVYVTHDQAEALALSDRIGVMNGGVLEQVEAPEKLYRDPATPFVASFVGGANLLEGELHDGAFRSAGHAFVLPDAVRAQAASQGLQGPARLVVRPEDLELVAGPPGTPLELSARLFLGHSAEYRFALGERLLRATGPVREARAGERPHVRIVHGKLFPAR